MVKSLNKITIRSQLNACVIKQSPSMQGEILCPLIMIDATRNTSHYLMCCAINHGHCKNLKNFWRIKVKNQVTGHVFSELLNKTGKICTKHLHSILKRKTIIQIHSEFVHLYLLTKILILVLCSAPRTPLNNTC